MASPEATKVAPTQASPAQLLRSFGSVAHYHYLGRPVWMGGTRPPAGSDPRSGVSLSAWPSVTWKANPGSGLRPGHQPGFEDQEVAGIGSGEPRREPDARQGFGVAPRDRFLHHDEAGLAKILPKFGDSKTVQRNERIVDQPPGPVRKFKEVERRDRGIEVGVFVAQVDFVAQ